MKTSTLTLLIITLLLTIPLISGVTYGSGTYDVGLYGQGESPPTASVDGGGGGGGGGASTTVDAIYVCSESSECLEAQFCFENSCNDAECFSDSVCNTEVGEACYDGRCVKLFDIKIIEFESPVKLGEFFDFTYLLKGVAEINGDVEVNFWITDNVKVVTSGSDVIFIGNYEEKIESTKLFLPSDIESGTYEFFISLKFENYEASAHRTIEIQVQDGEAIITMRPELKDILPYVVPILISLFLLVVIVIVYRERKKLLGLAILLVVYLIDRKKIKSKRKYRGNFISRHKFLTFILVLLIIAGILIYYSGLYPQIIDYLKNLIPKR